jgi:predicted transcriptional regulator YdeE
MASIARIDFVNFGPARVIGREIRVKLGEGSNPIPQFWMKCMEDGTFQTLEGMSEYALDPSYIGWEGEYDPLSKEFTYIVGRLMRPETPVPSSFASRDLSSCKMAIAWVKGTEPEIYRYEMDVTVNAMKEKGYEYDDSAGYTIEVYNYERFVMPQEKGEKEIILDYYVPCKG